MLGGPHVEPQPQAVTPNILVLARHELGLRDLKVHDLAELGDLRHKLAAPDLLHGCAAVRPHPAPGYQAGCMPHEPIHYLRLDMDPRRDALLQRRSQRPDLGLDVLDRPLDARVGVRLADR